MNLGATVGSTGDGTFERSVFERIALRNFDGVSLALRGGVSNTLAPIQFIDFKMIDVERPNTNSGAALYMHGQVEHCTFLSSRFDGNGNGVMPIGGTGIYMGRSFSAAPGTAIGPYGTGTAFSAQAPIQNTFLDCTSQFSTQAKIVDACDNINFISEWGEDITNWILAQNGAKAQISNGRPIGLGGGVGIQSNSTAQVTLVGYQPFLGTWSIALQTDGSGSIDTSAADTGTISMNNVVWTSSFGAGTTQFTTRGAPGIYASFTAAGIVVTQWDSSYGPGKTVICKINAASTFGVTFSNAGSSSLGFNLGNAVATLVCVPGDTVIFRRSMILKGWDLVAKV
jgi:hypothetical protein